MKSFDEHQLALKYQRWYLNPGSLALKSGLNTMYSLQSVRGPEGERNLPEIEREPTRNEISALQVGHTIDKQESWAQRQLWCSSPAPAETEPPWPPQEESRSC